MWGSARDKKWMFCWMIKEGKNSSLGERRQTKDTVIESRVQKLNWIWCWAPWTLTGSLQNMELLGCSSFDCTVVEFQSPGRLYEMISNLDVKVSKDKILTKGTESYIKRNKTKSSVSFMLSPLTTSHLCRALPWHSLNKLLLLMLHWHMKGNLQPWWCR